MAIPPNAPGPMCLDWAFGRFKHGIPSFFRSGCKAAPSRTPAPSSSIPTEGERLTGSTQCGCLPESADPFEDGREELSGHGDFRQLKCHVLGVPGDLGTDLDDLLLQRG